MEDKAFAIIVASPQKTNEKIVFLFSCTSRCYLARLQ